MFKILTRKQYKEMTAKNLRDSFDSKINEIKFKRAFERIQELEDTNNSLLVKVETCNTVIEREFEYSQQKKYEIKQLTEKLNKATLKHGMASLLINTHLKDKKRLEAKYRVLSDTLDHLNFQKEQETYEIEDLKEENALLNKQIDYLKTTLKNNLIVFEYQEHTKQPWFIQTNRGVEFNAFPYKRWQAVTKHAIEQRLKEVSISE